MAKPDQVIPPQGVTEPLTRARQLADTMAHALNDEAVLDVATAIAMLTSAVVNNYARDQAEAKELVEIIRRIEDRLLAKTARPSDFSLN
jgi:hypothetical protein